MASNKAASWLRVASRRAKRQSHACQRKESLHDTATSQRAATAAVTMDTPSEHTLNPGSSPAGHSERVHDMSELPGPPGWWVVGNFLTYLKKENQGKIHHVQMRYHKQFGPIFREKWGPNWQVHVSDPGLIEQVYRNQGEFPNRPGINAWKLYRDVEGVPTGILTSQGKEWQRMRSVLDKKLLAPREYTKYVKPMHQVSADLITRLEYLRESVGEQGLAEVLPNELYKWGVECAGVLLFDRRLGCLNNKVNATSQQFVDAFNDMFESSMQLIVGEKLQQKLNTKIWQKHSNAWTQIFANAKQYIQDKIDANSLPSVASEGSSCPFAKTSTGTNFVRDVMAPGKLSLAETFVNFSEMMIAGTDTVSNTLCFLLHELSQNQHVQEKLREEVLRVTQESGPEANIVGQMPYLDGVIKETLRLNPVATMQCRILDHDIDLAGYRVPKNTLFVLNHYATCRDPAVFEDPEEFRPERWSRNANGKHPHHAFASLPFGYGRRLCVGKRIARMELHLAVSKIVSQFGIEPLDDMAFEPIVRTMNSPGKQLPVRFVNR